MFKKIGEYLQRYAQVMAQCMLLTMNWHNM